MRALPLASLGMAAALGVAAGCGGGGSKAPATTSTSETSIEETTTSLATTTSTTIDPALRDILLLKEDLPSGFEEQATQSTRPALFATCDAATAPAVKALYEAPRVDGTTFERGADGAVKVSSTAIAAGPDQGEPAVTELSDAKVVECAESDLRALVEKDQPAGAEVTLKLTATRATVKGSDQTVLLSSTSTSKVDGTTKTVRLDLVFLRRVDTVLVITYAGPTSLATAAERQKIVAAAAAKLGGGASAGTSTTEASGRSTSTSRRTSTTRRSTTSSTRSGSTTSSTRNATTTSSGNTSTTG
jgi:hypothetical protein